MSVLRWVKYKSKSLKYRLFVLQFLGVIIPLSLLGYASYSTIYSMLINNIDEGIQNTLVQVRKDLEDTLSSLDYASLELSFEGSIGQKMSEYFRSEDQVEKRRIAGEIEQNVTLVNYTNKSLGVMAYYFPNREQFLFRNIEVMNDYNPFDNKVFMKSKDAIFFGPHRSAYRYGKHTVFSVVKQLHLPAVAGDQQPAYVYIESNFNKLQTTLNVSRYGMTSIHLLADSAGRIVFNASDTESAYGTGKGLESFPNYHFFYSSSDQGWQVIAGVKEDEYRKGIVNWFRSFSMIVIVSVMLSFLFFWFLWRMIYRPMKEIVKAIGAMEATHFDKSIPGSSVLEFDLILNRFSGMRSRVASLLTEVENKERLRGKLEVEKVLHQISPHFLYNSLNTIQWLAKIHGNDEINRLVIVLTRVLRYNLGKEGSFVTVEEELDALQDYIELQSIRYDYRFAVHFQIDEETKQDLIPRFIIQPLLENALYHGMDDENGKIALEVRRVHREQLQIVVSDNGPGMSPLELDRLLGQNIQDQHRSGLGIGLNYVIQILQSCYGADGIFHIESLPDQGTKVSIWLPLGRKST
ncbi:sensor histidine kinase [Cohnella silvisoli]|uniref:histidine kinase n=1 Tax=Cohnella silvisoli TaxID=2873699 RepID=A0ABV1L1X1_9BACL|nr:histidine kinase [Cohnella silvisoli]MCD9025709.1 histidine kinase [Cohnella silvisoli]